MPQQNQTQLDHAPTVETYLSRLDRELKPLPDHERDAARRELRSHVDALVAAHIELGVSEADATRAALRQFGDTRQIGGDLRREWRLTVRARRIGGARALRYATLWALAVHLATWACTFVLFAVLQKTLSGATSAGNAPAPEAANVLISLLLGFFCVAGPAAAGVVAETRAPGQGGSGVAWAGVVGTAFTVAVFAFAEANHPVAMSWEGALLISCIWVPTGMVAACATGWTRRLKTRLRAAG